MNTTSIPFYSNTPDDMRCAQACFRMVLKHFLPNNEYSWNQMDVLCHAQIGKGTWWFPVLIELNKIGLQTKMISVLDYKRLATEKFAYMKQRTNKKIASWYETHSNLVSVLPLLETFLTKNIWEHRTATVEDIDILLENGWLVGIELNAKTLNTKEGLSPHMVLIFKKEYDIYTFHDPGLPPVENRTVSCDELLKAWQFAGAENTSLIAIRNIKMGK